MDKKVIQAAKILWNYHLMHQVLCPSECILALGSHDLRVADRAAELFQQKMAPLVIMSGGLGNLTKEIWKEKEADLFAKRAINLGVPEENILIENRSTNTGENIRFSQELLASKKINPGSFILVQKPYMERRTFATFKKQWPGKDFSVTSPQISFEDYPIQEIPLERVINIMVGDLQRIIEYPEKGFQIPQEVPEAVKDAFNILIRSGFDKHLIK
ncbi:MAG: YdcF family protein [Bacteroidetes bacterium]|nr:YdcF family protein [Bacteroidota bacterium]MBS1929493.1 YdcF family protein [Bacteroidota bacterium]